MKPEIIMTRGLPASGKTTWARTQITPGGKIKRVNKDDLRSMLDSSFYNKPNEAFMLQMRDAIVRSAVSRGFSIIVDDTNFAPKHEETMKKIAEETGASFRIKDFSVVSLEECLKRDAAREKPVGEKVIREMHDRYLKKATPEQPRLVQDPNLPSAVICDLDGTLCHLNGRSPYDASTCENDPVNTNLLDVLKNLAFPVIFVSGRKKTFEVQTVNWLYKHAGNLDVRGLFMREEGDDRKDSIVKQEIFEKYIKPRFRIVTVFDDRNQVVEMWRGIGLTCFQVAPGDF